LRLVGYLKRTLERIFVENVWESRLLWGGVLKLLLNLGKSRKSFQNTNITWFD